MKEKCYQIVLDSNRVKTIYAKNKKEAIAKGRGDYEGATITAIKHIGDNNTESEWEILKQ